MHLTNKRVAVIGAGIGGLAAALALARRGARVTVCETAPQLGEVGAGLQISANGLRVLQGLGLDPLKEGSACFPDAVELVDYKHGREIARLPLNATPSQPFALFHRADLLKLLESGCRSSGVHFKLGQSVAVDDPAAGLISGHGEHPFDVIIAADGVRSQTRLKYFSGTEPVYTKQAAWRALVPANKAPSLAGMPGSRLYLGPGRHVVLYPLRNRTLINLVAVEERQTWTAEGWKQTDDAQNLRQAFRGWAPELTDILSHVESPLLWGFFAHPELPGWVVGRTALLGDAAHPMLPYMAQGACSALEDAWVLADALDQNPDTQAALQAYETRRKPRATRVQATSRGNTAIYHAANPLMRAGLHLGMRAAAQFAPALISNRFDWIHSYDVTKS